MRRETRGLQREHSGRVTALTITVGAMAGLLIGAAVTVWILGGRN